MPIDVDVPGSHGWWFKKLAARQAERLPRLEGLHKRYTGDAPMPAGPREAEAAFRAFQKLARTSYEDTIVRAVLDRQTLTAFRTAAENDDGGDKKAAEIWAANEMPVAASDILAWKLSMSEGYASISPPDDESGGIPVIVAEDPRQCITSQDPVRRSRTRAGLKMFYDPDEGIEVAYVAVRGGVKREDGTVSRGAVVRRAQRKARSSSLTADFRFGNKAWDWVPEEGWTDNALELPMVRCPFVQFRTRDGLAEFEKHIDLIDRIRHTILQRMVIITMQAFRQRAVKGLPDRYPDDYPVTELRGKQIDYSGVFTNDPAAVWLLPAGTEGKAVELWESGELRIEGVLNAVKDDIREMASATRTPFYEFVPDGANQTATGATVMREGITFKTEDHNTRDGIAFAHLMSLAFELMDDKTRMKIGQLESLWAPVERFDLAAKADAAQKAKGIRPILAILTDIYQLTPAQALRERDMLRDEQADALLLAPPTGTDPLRVPSTRGDQGTPPGGTPPAIDAGTTSTGDQSTD